MAKAAFRALDVFSEVCGVNIVNTSSSVSLVLVPPHCAHRPSTPQPPVHLTGFSENGDCLHPAKRQPGFQSVLGIKRTLEGPGAAEPHKGRPLPCQWLGRVGPLQNENEFCTCYTLRRTECPVSAAVGTRDGPVRFKGASGRERILSLLNSDTHSGCSRFCGSCNSSKTFVFSVDHPFPLRI